MEKKLNFMLIAIIAFLSMAVAFIVIYLVMTGGVIKSSGNQAGDKGNTKSEKKVEIDHSKTATCKIDMGAVNLKSDANNANPIVQLKVEILLADKKFEEEFKTREGEVKDIILTTFWNKTKDEIKDGKAVKIKEELLVKIKAIFKNPKEAQKVIDIFFESLIWQ